MADYRNVRAHLAQTRIRRRRSLTSLLGGIIAGAAILTSSSGCSTFSGLSQSLKNCDCVDDFMVGYRNQALAAQAWHEHKHCYECQKHLKDFAAGFKQGYEDVASGSDGCTPAIAPEAYWGWRYQSPEGQAKVAAWFAGYPMGVKAAEQDGLGNWSQIPTMFPQPVAVPPYTPDYSVQPDVGVTPEGIPVVTSPLGNRMAPTPVEPLNWQSTTPLQGSGPFTEEMTLGDDEPAPVREAFDGTTARGPAEPFYLTR